MHPVHPGHLGHLGHLVSFGVLYAPITLPVGSALRSSVHGVGHLSRIEDTTFDKIQKGWIQKQRMWMREPETASQMAAGVDQVAADAREVAEAGELTRTSAQPTGWLE